MSIPRVVSFIITKSNNFSLIVKPDKTNSNVVEVVVEWLKRRPYDQHGLGSKHTRAILLCPWERYFTALFPAWWSWKAALNYSHISIKLQADSNILASWKQVGELPILCISDSVAFLRVRRINIEIK